MSTNEYLAKAEEIADKVGASLDLEWRPSGSACLTVCHLSKLSRSDGTGSNTGPVWQEISGNYWCTMEKVKISAGDPMKPKRDLSSLQDPLTS